ncbi:beta-xylosidase, partial [Paenibacillus sp. EKM208P]
AVASASFQPCAAHANTTGVTQATYGIEVNQALNGLNVANAELSLSATASTAITNGTDWKDTAGNPIQANSGNILKVGSTYYWYGEHAE